LGVVQVHDNKDQQEYHEHTYQENSVIYDAERDEKATPCVTTQHRHVVNEDQGHHRNGSDEGGGLQPSEKAYLRVSRLQELPTYALTIVELTGYGDSVVDDSQD
tara:strand:+ start:795 stop:1106 length:312 start_codon:yes stop_codon:yes gene_type:complete